MQIFELANMRSADLMGADLRFANLAATKISNTNLKSADLRFANLQSADLQDSNMVATNMRGAYLKNAKVSASYARGSNVTSTWDETTILPDGTNFKRGRRLEQLQRFINPEHPDFWRPDWVNEWEKSNLTWAEWRILQNRP